MRSDMTVAVALVVGFPLLVAIMLWLLCRFEDWVLPSDWTARGIPPSAPASPAPEDPRDQGLKIL